MAETKYTYSVTSDTASSKIHPGRLRKEITDSAIATGVNHIIRDDDVIDVYMDDALSGGDKTTLDGILSSHGGDPLDYVSVEATATTATSTTSASYVVMSGMTITPESGSYFVSFSASGHGTFTGQENEYAMFLDGSILQESYRKLDWHSGQAATDMLLALHSQIVVPCDGTEVLDVRYKTDQGTFEVIDRTLILIKVE